MTSSNISGIDLAGLYIDERLKLVRLAILLVDDFATAEDTVHDAFISLQEHQLALHEPSAAKSYLRTCVVNNARSVLRKRRTVRAHLRGVHDRESESADTELMLSAEHQMLLVALRQLPRRQHEVLVLRYWSDLTEADIAQTLGISPGTVKSTASRALAKLETLMGGQR